MGQENSTRSGAGGDNEYKFKVIKDAFRTVGEVQTALQQKGLEASQMIVGVDFTKSNEWAGKYTFWGKNLHSLEMGGNQYQEVISFVARTLAYFDDDKMIPCYGFGDVTTGSSSVFSFMPNDQPLMGLESVIDRYRQVVSGVDLSGPTSFAPIIRQAMRIVENSGMEYHVLVIIADGQVSSSCERETIQALVDASNFPMSIILVGVGDGPWETMRGFDDKLPSRRFDNFQFVDFNRVMMAASKEDSEEQRNAHFAVNAMMELPEQYKAINRLRLLGAKPQPGLLDTQTNLVLEPPPRVPPPVSAPPMPLQF